VFSGVRKGFAFLFKENIGTVLQIMENKISMTKFSLCKWSIALQLEGVVKKIFIILGALISGAMGLGAFMSAAEAGITYN